MSGGPDAHTDWLAAWYVAQCDGDWEHRHGVTIGTLDNPGWIMEVDLQGTALEVREFAPTAVGAIGTDHRHGGRWHDCRVVDGRFRGAGGSLDLLAVVGVFREWAEGEAG